MTNWKDHVNNINHAINAISPSFCVAKWKQVTMHLQNGQTHSCHHPDTHAVPIEEVVIDASALHNTNYKKQQRKKMLEGERPSECSYCWRVEDAGQLSDRTFKSADHWAYPYIDEIVKTPWTQNVDPSYVEVSFSNVCNFKCSYCAPHISSQWMEEIERHGPYPTSHRFNNIEWLKRGNKMPIANNQDNPYVDAFWQWWPTMYRELKTFRITGGEPLLSKNTFKVLDYINENPNPELNFSVNTNLNVPDELLNRFIEKIKDIQKNKKIKSFVLHTSAEAHGTQAEYIRYGMNYADWIKNLNRVIVEIPGGSVNIMSTYNLMSVPSYTKFLEDIFYIRQAHAPIAQLNRRPAVTLDIPYLREPKHQAAYLIPENLMHYVHEQIAFMESCRDHSGAMIGFNDHEIYKLHRIRSVIQDELRNPAPDTNQWRKDFTIFVREHDLRRGTDFVNTFPELKDMYESWQSL
jgi:organic radical activating enzyme